MPAPAASRRWFPAGLTAAYALVLAFGLAHHEMWRDELQAWLLARDSANPADLLANLKYEGHPALWYLLLMPLTRVSASPVAMQALHLVIASATVFLVARFAPFTRLQSALFAFGYFPLYEYGVISRSYALSLLLVVVACVFLRDRWRRPVRLGVALFLLSHTSVHGAILALAFLFGLVLDFLLQGRGVVGGSSVALRRVCVAFLLALSGFLLSVVQLLPAPDTGVAGIGAPVVPILHFDASHFADCLRLFAFVFFFPLGRDFPLWMTNVPFGFPDLDALYSIPVACILLAAIVWYHRRRSVPLGVYLCSVFGLLAFSYVYYPGDLRHHGFLLIAFLMLFWSGQALSPSSPCEGSSFPPAPPHRRYASVLLSIFLAFHAFGGIRAFLVDLLLPFSLAHRTAEYLRTESLDSLPMIGDEDFATSAVLGFLEDKRSIHYARADRAGTFIRWDAARRTPVTDAELLSRTAALAAREDSPVVLILNHPLLLPLEQYPEVRSLVSFTGALFWDANFHLYLHDAPAPVPAAGWKCSRGHIRAVGECVDGRKRRVFRPLDDYREAVPREVRIRATARSSPTGPDPLPDDMRSRAWEGAQSAAAALPIAGFHPPGSSSGRMAPQELR